MSPRKFFCAAVLLSVVTSRADDFILSYWCGPPETQDLNKCYAEVAACGFNYAMMPCTGVSVKGNQAILDACKKHKLKYIAYDSRVLAFDPESPAFKTNLDAIISEYGKHPALGAYFIADEPVPSAFPQLAAVNQHLLARDPKHLPLINLFPNYAPEWALGPYEQYVEKFVTTVKPRLLSFDHYALTTDGKLRSIYFENLEIIRRQSLKHDVPFGFIFQLTAHGGYRDPSEEELRWQVNTALAYGAKALLYFTYWSPSDVPLFKSSVAIIDSQGNRSPHYERVKRINAEIKAWSPTLMKLKSTAVYHTGELPRATIALPKDAVVQIEGDAPFIIGTFEHHDGSEWLMIMNSDMRQPANAIVRFDDRIKRLRELSSGNGKLSSLKLRKHELPLQLSAGAAKLFKLSR